MAGETAQRTEKPTPKRLREARRRGQIPRSSDLVGWLAVLIGSFALPYLARSMFRSLAAYFAQTRDLVAAGRYSDAMAESMVVTRGLGLALGSFLALVLAVTAVGMSVQGGITLTTEPLRPRLERISPKAGLKRLVSAQSAVDTAKAAVRLVVLGVIVWAFTRSFLAAYLAGTESDLGALGPGLASVLLLVVRLAAAVGLVIGLGDYVFQRHKVAKSLRMSKHEVKQETKTTEGDPMVRSRRRAMHAKVGRNQMLAAVGDASVVVVNPTHVAVALRYEPGGVPVVVAKGGDELALRIRDRAFEAEVPVVEARPLARILHDTLDVGAEVPAEMYEAVAIVIAFVMNAPPLSVEGLVRRVNVPPSALVGVGAD